MLMFIKMYRSVCAYLYKQHGLVGTSRDIEELDATRGLGSMTTGNHLHLWGWRQQEEGGLRATC